MSQQAYSDIFKRCTPRAISRTIASSDAAASYNDEDTAWEESVLLDQSKAFKKVQRHADGNRWIVTASFAPVDGVRLESQMAAEKKYRATFVEHEQAGEPKRKVTITAKDEEEAISKAERLAYEEGMTLTDLVQLSRLSAESDETTEGGTAPAPKPKTPAEMNEDPKKVNASVVEEMGADEEITKANEAEYQKKKIASEGA